MRAGRDGGGQRKAARGDNGAAAREARGGGLAATGRSPAPRREAAPARRVRSGTHRTGADTGVA